MEGDETRRGRGKNKQYWNEEEVKALIDILQELAADPLWKTDGGFRNNYMNEVHRRLLLKIPTFAKQISPHLESKIKWLKTKYHLINEMVRQSGCQWNDVECKIACERQWFDDWCKHHKEAKGLWELKFPYLRALDDVYGRDKATGAPSQTFEQAIKGLENSINMEAENEIYNALSSSSDSENADVGSSIANATPMTSSTSQASNKRKKLSPRRETKAFKKKMKSAPQKRTLESKFDEISGKLGSFVEAITAQNTAMTNAIIAAPIPEPLASNKMKEVVKELLNLGLPSGDVYKAGEILCEHPSKVEMLFSLPFEMRRQYVISFLYPSSS